LLRPAGTSGQWLAARLAETCANSKRATTGEEAGAAALSQTLQLLHVPEANLTLGINFREGFHWLESVEPQRLQRLWAPRRRGSPTKLWKAGSRLRQQLTTRAPLAAAPVFEVPCPSTTAQQARHQARHCHCRSKYHTHHHCCQPAPLPALPAAPPIGTGRPLCNPVQLEACPCPLAVDLAAPALPPPLAAPGCLRASLRFWHQRAASHTTAVGKRAPGRWCRRR